MWGYLLGAPLDVRCEDVRGVCSMSSFLSSRSQELDIARDAAFLVVYDAYYVHAFTTTFFQARFVELRSENEHMRKAQAAAAVLSRRRGEESKKVAGNSSINKGSGERGRKANLKAEKEETTARDVPGRRRLDAEQQGRLDEEQGEGEWSSNSAENDDDDDNDAGDGGGVFLRLLQAIQPVSHVYWED